MAVGSRVFYWIRNNVKRNPFVQHVGYQLRAFSDPAATTISHFEAVVLQSKTTDR